MCRSCPLLTGELRVLPLICLAACSTVDGVLAIAGSVWWLFLFWVLNGNSKDGHSGNLAQQLSDLLMCSITVRQSRVVLCVALFTAATRVEQASPSTFIKMTLTRMRT